MTTNTITDRPSTPSNSSILFKPGRVVATPGALEAMEKNNILSMDLLTRHLTGD